MSLVTNVILSFDSLEDEAARLADVNAVLARDKSLGGSPRFAAPVGMKGPRDEDDPSDCDCLAGSKYLERPTYVGAFNFLQIQEFKIGIEAIRWEHPKNVQVLVCEQESSRYYVLVGSVDREYE